MGEILHFAYEGQLDGAFATTEEGIAWLVQLDKIPADGENHPANEKTTGQ